MALRSTETGGGSVGIRWLELVDSERLRDACVGRRDGLLDRAAPPFVKSRY